MFLNKPFTLLISACTLIFTSNGNVFSAETANNKRFKNLRNAIFSEPYETLPTYKVSRKLFGKSRDQNNNKLLKAAKRTFNDKRDLINFEAGQKLLQANGICFAGVWQIDHASPFTGLFAENTSSPVIVRISVALNGTLQKHKRAIGMAIKLLPDDLGLAPSINAFVMHSIGGVVKKHTLDLTLDNQPPLGSLPRWSDLSTALRLRKDFEQAEKDNQNGKPRINFRPVSHLAAHQTDTAIVTPKWLRLSTLNAQRIDLNDFREELDVKHYENQTLLYQIDVAADHGGKKSNAQWQTIGKLRLTESVTSAACDQQLHFTHPTLAPKQAK